MRIVSLLASATETLFALGLGDQIVAVSHECDYPPAARSRPRATRSLIDSALPSDEIDRQVKQRLAAGLPLYEIDRNLVRRLAPDLLITQAQCDVCAVRYQDVVELVATEPALAGAKVLALNPRSLGDVVDDMRRVGAAVGQAEAADRYVQTLRDRLDQIAQRSSSDGPRPRVVCLEWLDPLMAAGNWTPELIEIAGGRSCLAAANAPSGYIAWQQVCDLDPDVLIAAPCGFDLARSLVEARRLSNFPGVRSFAAAADGRIYVVDGNAYLNRSGPRIVETAELLAHLICPNRFPPPTGELAEGRAWQRLDR